MKHEIKLKRIKDYVDNCAGYDIGTKLRTTEVVSYRTLYFKLAIDTTHYTLKKIGNVVNRDHATVLHSKKLFDELMSNEYFKSLEEVYKIEVLGEQVNAPYRDIMQYNKLKEKYNKLLSHKISLSTVLKISEQLTINEQAYRKLSEEEKKVYDERAKLVLKSFEWKRKDAERKEEYEIIIGEPTVTDARASLR